MRRWIWLLVVLAIVFRVALFCFALARVPLSSDEAWPALMALHILKGELKGFFSVTVRANWRIIFQFENRDAFGVDFVDYH
jgi:proteic killer suppression protein